ncbi:MAG: M1 family metallopeptidase [Cruoricaptor ignavus]|nr:M1 family metallopeptidase [Cruoricaptor ignavus]
MKYIIVLSLFCSGILFGQNFTKQDTLKGSDTEFRNFWDVKKYDISVNPDFNNKSISGKNTISFEIVKDVINPTFQIDLQQPMMFSDIKTSFPKDYKRDGDFIFIKAKQTFKKGENHTISISFQGKPIEAKNAPWDGGWVFAQDQNGNPFSAVAQQGIGASVWLPIKDIWNDEPDNGITMELISPENLIGVGNGRLISQSKKNGKNIFVWEVKNPINAYSIAPSFGKYVNFKDQFSGEKGKLDLDYWVLDYNLDKAKKQFGQVKPMLKAFEYWFGPYPFYEDSYKIVETPFLGMEHQSNVAYGNHYENGYLGTDLSETGVGLKWDFIIIHESGHEWFANNITAKDQADMWIHEAFTSYSETLFTEFLFGKNDANTYLQGTRHNILNDIPMIGNYGVRNHGSTDMYYKGANMLHTIRQVINQDEKFRKILRGLNEKFRHQTVTSKQVEEYISKESGIDFSTVFDQYLRTTKIPVLEYFIKDNQLNFRYQNTVENFTLPIKLENGTIINPNDNWQNISLKPNEIIVFDKNYYIDFEELTN